MQAVYSDDLSDLRKSTLPLAIGENQVVTTRIPQRFLRMVNISGVERADIVLRTEKRSTLLATFDLTSPRVHVFRLGDIDKNLVCRRQDPAWPISYIRKS